jgi:polyhydroxybutyrate depolymerase
LTAPLAPRRVVIRLRLLPRARYVLAALLVAAVAYVALLRFAPAEAPPPLAAPARGALEVAGRQRSFVVYLPPRRAPHPALLLAFHGSFETGASFRQHSGYSFDHLADALGFVVVYPDGFERHWNDCRTTAQTSANLLHVDDVGFARALIAHFRATAGIDPTRVFAAGYSNGGQMTFRLALEMPDEIRAAAAISANLLTDVAAGCRVGSKASPILIMNGTADPIVPFAGGRVSWFGLKNRGEVRSAVDTARFFAHLEGAAASAVTARLPGDDATLWVERSLWDGPGPAPVELVAIHGGGHVVPQGRSRYPRLFGRTASFDGPAEIWRFFTAQAPPPPTGPRN